MQMIRNSHLLRKFEDEWIRSKPRDYEANLRIFESLYEEARSLGVLPRKDPWEGIERKIELARIINSVPGSPQKTRS